MIAISQQANALCGGYADEMLCARAYRLQNKGWLRWVYFWDAVFWWDPDHCQKCYQEEQLELNLPEEYHD